MPAYILTLYRVQRERYRVVAPDVGTAILLAYEQAEEGTLEPFEPPEDIGYDTEAHDIEQEGANAPIEA